MLRQNPRQVDGAAAAPACSAFSDREARTKGSGCCAVPSRSRRILRAPGSISDACSGPGYYADAIDSTARATALEPDNAIPHSMLASALSSASRTDAAIGEFERALELRPDQPASLLGLAHW